MKEEGTDVFRGNMIFASVNQFKFKITSRRDDLISLVFMLVFLFNDGNLPFISEEQDSMQRNQIFQQIKQAKLEMTPANLCNKNCNPADPATSSRASCLIEFATEVFQLGFSDTPDYDRFMKLLEAVLIQKGHKLDFVFDWSENHSQRSVERTHDNDLDVSQNPNNVSKSFVADQDSFDGIQGQVLTKIKSMSENNHKLFSNKLFDQKGNYQ